MNERESKTWGNFDLCRKPAGKEDATMRLKKPLFSKKDQPKANEMSEQVNSCGETKSHHLSEQAAETLILKTNQCKV